MECQKCGSTNDTTEFYIGDDKHVLCVECRYKLLINRKQGRPSLGVTKKVSMTLDEDDWDWIEKQSKGNKSKFFRYLINQEQNTESRWSNDAARGYMIFALEKLEYDSEEITKIINMMYGAFDMKTVDEAKKKYIESDY